MNFRRILLVTTCALFLQACAPDKPTFKAIDLTGADYAQGFQLKDQFGQVRTLADFKGQVVVVFFGFTQCPDFCPTTLSEWVQVKKALGENSQKLQAVFITVDPERDTSERLQRFIGMFNQDIIGLTGDPATLSSVYKAYGAGATRRDLPDSALVYAMDHTATSTIIDKQGQRRLLFGFGTSVDDMFSDLSALINE
jgi:protein SCO1/2